ncbi:MAG: sigma-70 family RNA polymerase sigma factor [bacterium]
MDEAKKTGATDLVAIRDDAGLVRKAVAGDASAKGEIVERHMRNVYNLALRLTGNPDEAENVLQDTFLKVFEKLNDFRADSQLGTWIHRIATNEALMRLRSKKGKWFVPIEEEPVNGEETGDIGFIVQSLDRDPLTLTLDDELRKKLEKAILSLPETLRTAFVLKDLEGLSMAEIGEKMGKTVAAVKADLHRARLRLRGRLAEFVDGRDHGA